MTRTGEESIGVSLQRMGHEVELVADGRKAVEVYESAKGLGRPFDAVILDLTIRGGLGGQEAIQALLQMDPAVKAVVMSGYANAPVVLEPERYGFKGALVKPFDFGKLQEMVSRVMGSDRGDPRHDARCLLPFFEQRGGGNSLMESARTTL